MPEMQLDSADIITQDYSAAAHESVTFGGGCIATAFVAAGQEMGGGGRLTTIVEGFVDEQLVAGSGTIDYDGSFNSPGPTSITFAVPLGKRGKIALSGGRPSRFKVTLVRNAI